MTDVKYGVEMYVRFSLDQKEFRFFAPVSFDQIVSEKGLSSSVVASNLQTVQMADIVINLANETLVKTRNPGFELTDEVLSHIKSIPLTDYDVVTAHAFERGATYIIGEFKGPYHFLSNFHPATFVYNNILWPNSEAAYQAMKSLDHEVHLTFAQYESPGVAKRAGRHIDPIRKDWNEVKFGIMRDIVYAKFIQNPDLKQRLLGTGAATLQEGNSHGDLIWGICPPYSSRGENNLGKILMKLRQEFRTIQF